MALMTVPTRWNRSDLGIATLFVLGVVNMLGLLFTPTVRQVNQPLPFRRITLQDIPKIAREGVNSTEAAVGAERINSLKSSVGIQMIENYDSDVRKERVNYMEAKERVETNIRREKESKPVQKEGAEKTRLGNTTEEPEKCRCGLAEPKWPTVTLGQLNLTHPWLNVSTAHYLRQQHPNFPIDLMKQMLTQKTRCSLLPKLCNINWINTYWQEARLSEDVLLYLYSAIYDNRTLIDVRPCVRLLVWSMTPRPPRPWCHLWFNVTGPPASSRAVRIETMEKEEVPGMVFLVTCPVPAETAELQPQAVSLVPRPCTLASNLLKVAGSGEREPSAYLSGILPQHSSRSLPRYSVAVCGPALFYYHQDFSWRLVEWLEILRAQGIARVFLYEVSLHPNVQKVLWYYEKEGFLGVTQYAYPPPYDNEPNTRRLWTLLNREEMFKQEKVYFNDCLLRHMHQYRFIAHYDPDEVPLLLHHNSYNDLLNELLNRSYSELVKSNVSLPVAYKLHWSIFYDDVEPPSRTHNLPKFLHVMRHILRPKKDEPQTPGRFKALYDMDTVTGVYSHGAIICGTGWCPSDGMKIDPHLAYLGHFTRKCGQKCKKEGYLKEEAALMQYKDMVQEAVTRVLTELNLL